MLLPAIAATLLIAQAAPAAPPCPATPVPPTGAFAGWPAATKITAAANAGDAGGASMILGTRADVALAPLARFSYVRTPPKPDAAGSFAGLASVTIARAGTYQIGLGGGAWIDVIGADGTALASTAHGHGPACSGLHKIVDFALVPGRYLVQISNSPTPVIAVMVVAKP